MGIGVGVVVHFRIEYGVCLGQRVVRHVVVANDEIYAVLFCIGNFVDCLYSAIEHDYQFDIIGYGMVDAFYRYAIAFFIACRNIVFNV